MTTEKINEVVIVYYTDRLLDIVRKEYPDFISEIRISKFSRLKYGVINPHYQQQSDIPVWCIQIYIDYSSPCIAINPSWFKNFSDDMRVEFESYLRRNNFQIPINYIPISDIFMKYISSKKTTDIFNEINQNNPEIVIASLI